MNANLRQTGHDRAREGFIAMCPDQSGRQTPGVDLSVTSEPDWNAGSTLYNACDQDAEVRDILAAALRFSAALPGASRKVAVLGFCLGRLMTSLAAARGHADAAVAFHGANTEKYPGEISNITAPMLMHLAEADDFISPAAQAAIKAARATRPNINVFTYQEHHHAFSRHGGTHYYAVAAAKANGRAFAFLKAQVA